MLKKAMDSFIGVLFLVAVGVFLLSILLGNILIVGVNAKAQESEITRIIPTSDGKYMYEAEYRKVEDTTFPSAEAYENSKSGDMFYVGEKVKVVYFSLYPSFRSEIHKLD